MISRRSFVASTAFVTVGLLGVRRHVRAMETSGLSSLIDPDRFGPLKVDPARILDLPEGFSYRVISRTGDAMDDGLLVPGKPDGMAAFEGEDGLTVLLMNHEMESNLLTLSPFARDASRLARIDAAKLYDPVTTLPDNSKGPALGGTSTLLYDTKNQRVARHFMSLAGTLRNCAGGPTPWGSWITCEETVIGPKQGCAKWHGYNFEVPSSARSLVDPVPLIAMGRFNHEAVAVDPASGMVYQTEDRGDGLIYRFVPAVPGQLARGGKLQALVVVDRPSLDTRNWEAHAVDVGKPMRVTWLDIDDVESPDDSIRLKGFERGAARFARGEGMWYGEGSVYFACTNGGSAKKGQIWKLDPASDQLELFVEPNDGTVVDNADNLCVSPWGEVFVCEDGGGGNRVLAISPEGKVSTFALNAWNASEMAGVCFSPDGSTMFVSIQHDPGMTLAITGPWRG